jgi:diguanylate cyclase (GGDEF)-like protein
MKATTLVIVAVLVGGGWMLGLDNPGMAVLSALAVASGAWALLPPPTTKDGAVPSTAERFDPAKLAEQHQAVLMQLATLADERELQRGLFEVSTELVGCVTENDARVRFAAAVRRYWAGSSADLMVWNKGTWRSLGGPASGLPPVLDHPVQLPNGLAHEGDLILDLSPGVVGHAALILRRAGPQPSLAGRSYVAQLAVAEILRAQLALSLRRVLLYSELQDLARSDPLTTTHRRWYGEGRLAELVDGGKVVTVAMIDIDHFKLVNDTYGHSIGDYVLTAVGRTLSAALRTNDLVCRWGGEEFLVVLPDTLPEGGFLVAQRLRQAIADLHDLPTPVTVSIGVAACTQDDVCAKLIARADEALYRAKKNGRDCVMMATMTGAPGSLRLVSRPPKEHSRSPV